MSDKLDIREVFRSKCGHGVKLAVKGKGSCCCGGAATTFAPAEIDGAVMSAFVRATKPRR